MAKGASKEPHKEAKQIKPDEIDPRIIKILELKENKAREKVSKGAPPKKKAKKHG